MKVKAGLGCVIVLGVVGAIVTGLLFGIAALVSVVSGDKNPADIEHRADAVADRAAHLASPGGIPSEQRQATWIACERDAATYDRVLRFTVPATDVPGAIDRLVADWHSSGYTQINRDQSGANAIVSENTSDDRPSETRTVRVRADNGVLTIESKADCVSVSSIPKTSETDR